jgi:hypothetical protein
MPEMTKNAFLAAMEVTLRSVQYNGVSEVSSITPTHVDLLARESIHRDALGLPHLQTLLFLTLEATNRGAYIMRGGHGPKPGNYIAMLVEEGHNLEIFSHKVVERSRNEPALILARSIALCIGLLDIFNGLSLKRQTPARIGSLTNVFLTMKGDLPRVGSRLYWMSRKILPT